MGNMTQRLIWHDNTTLMTWWGLWIVLTEVSRIEIWYGIRKIDGLMGW